MSNNVTLKPCPFCGGAGDISYWAGPGADSTPKGQFVECEQCSAAGPGAEIGAHTDAKAEAITAWNTRAQQSVPNSVVEAANAAWCEYDPPETALSQTHRQTIISKHAFIEGYRAATLKQSGQTEAGRTLLDVGALPDRIQLFRMLREAGRSDKAKAEAIEAHLLYLAEYHGRTATRAQQSVPNGVVEEVERVADFQNRMIGFPVELWEKVKATLQSGQTAAELLREAREALAHAKDQFYRYAKLHRAKGTEDGDVKACTNAGYGEEMAEAIARIDTHLSQGEGA